MKPTIEVNKQTVEDIVKKYCGQFPAPKGRKLANTWAELRVLMEVDIQMLISDSTKQLREENERLRSEVTGRFKIDKSIPQIFVDQELDQPNPANYKDQIKSLTHLKELAEKENERLTALINQPEIEDFIKGVKIEAAHQVERWGIENEESSPPHHFVLVLNKLMGKLSVDIFDHNSDKYKHHLIAIAAEMFNIHRQIKKQGTEINKWFNPLN